MSKTLSILSALLLPLALVACGSQDAKTPLDQAPLAGAAIGGDFTLIDKSNKQVKWADFAGKWRVVYFGFTNCPDVCPTDLGILVKGYKKFGEANRDLADSVQPIFITIDPERDTPSRMGEYTAAFSPRLIGLTGTSEQIDAVAKTFAVYHAKGEATPDGGYAVNHSRGAYLFDPQGKPIATLPIDKGSVEGPDAVAAELAKWVR